MAKNTACYRDLYAISTQQIEQKKVRVLTVLLTQCFPIKIPRNVFMVQGKNPGINK